MRHLTREEGKVRGDRKMGKVRKGRKKGGMRWGRLGVGLKGEKGVEEETRDSQLHQ